jgi:hypothetical protein
VTEPDWLAATDPAPLIAYIRGRATGRQLAMAAIALCRSDRDLMRPGYSRDGIVWSERVTEVLAHCRGPGPHVRGCWVVDLVLGKG